MWTLRYSFLKYTMERRLFWARYSSQVRFYAYYSSFPSCYLSSLSSPFQQPYPSSFLTPLFPSPPFPSLSLLLLFSLPLLLPSHSPLFFNPSPSIPLPFPYSYPSLLLPSSSPFPLPYPSSLSLPIPLLSLPFLSSFSPLSFPSLSVSIPCRCRYRPASLYSLFSMHFPSLPHPSPTLLPLPVFIFLTPIPFSPLTIFPLPYYRHLYPFSPFLTDKYKLQMPYVSFIDFFLFKGVHLMRLLRCFFKMA
jgi:hypothetical protein